MSTPIMIRRDFRAELLHKGPGLLLCAAAVVLSTALSGFAVSPLLIAIILGVLLANTIRMPDAVGPGLGFAAKQLLRLGIVFLGLQLVLGDIAALGWPMIAVIVCIVAGGMTGTLLIARMLRIRTSQALLIACGFSICGAAAVAAADGVSDADEEEVVTAVALVVLFGTLMIPVVPFLAPLVGLGEYQAGLWAGGSIHEVAQVVAAGGAIGGGALAVAVVVKLARVLMLAPVMAVISARRRASHPDAGSGRRPPVVPLFILAFLAMVILRSAGLVPDPVLQAGQVAETALLSAAMFALGCGVKIQRLKHVGGKPFLLAACATVLVGSIALVGILLVTGGSG